ncbi:MAG: 2-iminobutanoate/2-iminopropanoate deaminase [Verrucomicrobia subdivision 3 bacterium]|nr:2-iminobutanoate/2-iminopropanoate deaminase [Limisphaerales bacterium]MCS1415033.1 2-iminobutanoate/2-iminopropanoate deaminase [Limisphaerales bacterium]
MKKKRPFSPSASPKALGPYNHGVQFGDFLFTAGQIPLDPESGSLVGDDIADQTKQVLENLRLILESESLSLEHILKTTVFMVHLSELQQVNAVYAEYFPQSCPARSTVQVAALPMRARIEIEAIAHY